VSKLRLHGEIVAGKGLSFHDDPVAHRCRLVEGEHEEVQVRRESLHHRNFVWLGADNAGHSSLGILVDVNPRLGEAVVEDLEMTVYAFGSPRLQIALDVPGGLLWLEDEGVSTKINRVLRFRIVLILYGQLAMCSA